MKLLMRDGSTFEGEPLELLREWKSLSFDPPELTLAEYVAAAVARAWEWDGVRLDVQGDSEEELAESFFSEVVRTELAVRLDAVLH